MRAPACGMCYGAAFVAACVLDLFGVCACLRVYMACKIAHDDWAYDEWLSLERCFYVYKLHTTLI